MVSLPSRPDLDREEPPLRGDEGHWDSRGKIILLGLIVPAGLLAWIALDLVIGRVFLPSGRGWLRRAWDAYTIFDEPLVFFGVMMLKLAVAGWALTVWALGNHPRLGWHSESLLIGLGALGVVGFILTAVGVVM